jgi:hypothetical protein
VKSPAPPIRLAFLALVLAAGLAIDQGRAGDAALESAAALFKRGEVLNLRVEIEPREWSALKADHRQDARCTVREGTNIYNSVGVHLKGAAGSFRELDDKPALTLTFNRFEPKLRFHGLRKIHLNNSVQDPSYMTELICGEMFEAAGVPAPRVAHARVTLNGRDVGFYVVKEGFTRDFLARNFKQTDGNLYDGGFLKDVADLINDESNKQYTNKSDLKALSRAARERDPAARWEKLGHVLDMDRFISLMAMEVLVWHWDGYSMNRNNYRLYGDSGNGKMVFFPHGMDQMFGEAGGPIQPEMQGAVASAVIQTPEGRRRYLDRIRVLFNEAFNLQVLTNRINDVYARIHPAIAAISDEAAREHAEAVNDLRERVANRHRGIETQFDEGTLTTLQFDAHGVATPANWKERDPTDGTRLDPGTDSQGNRQLHIRASEGCRASWRTRVILDPGRYRFEGTVRTAKVVAISDDRGEGAGLRISGQSRNGGNKITGTSGPRVISFPFEVSDSNQSIELICELRGNSGDAWFDVGSLKIIHEAR